jgi:hypothetical protein
MPPIRSVASKPGRAETSFVLRSSWEAVGYEDAAVAARATGIAPTAIGWGLKETATSPPPIGEKLCRRTGKVVALEHDPLALMAPMTPGCPKRPLLWVPKSLVKLCNGSILMKATQCRSIRSKEIFNLR